MENFQVTSSMEAGIVEKEEFYEEIEAPKFVDFTIPNHFSPDDRFWFCSRVGCDQKHEEEMDPEAIYKNFVIRVMAARSPNVKFGRAISRKSPSESKKCPNSAPPKPSKSRLPRLALVSSSISKKLIDAENGKLKLKPPMANVKPASTPKARVKHVAAKYMTSPRKKKGSSPKSNAFRSVQTQRKRAFRFPRASEKLETPVTKLCEGVSNLQINSQKKSIARKPLKERTSERKKLPSNGSRKIQSSRTKVTDAESTRSVKNNTNKVEKGGDECSDMEIDEKLKYTVTIQAANVKERKQEKSNTVADDLENQNPGVVGELEDNDDKENVSNSDNIRNLCSENLSKQHGTPVKLKVKTKQNPSKLDKTSKENCPAGTGTPGLKNRKLKPTNPKPFRLRTDERGILKEATLERKGTSMKMHLLQVKTHSSRHQGIIEHGVSENKEKGSKKDGGKGFKKDQLKAVKSRYKDSKKEEPRSERSSGKTKSPFLQKQLAEPQREISSRVKSRELGVRTEKTAMSKRKELKKQGKEVDDPIKKASVAQKSAAQGKRSATIPREPKFHSLHKTKGSTRNKI
ncbi:putative mRNA-capping enzyme [Bienertia sinuspersici]